MEKTQAEIVTEQLTDRYWQTVAEIHERVRQAGWIMSRQAIHNVLKYLARTGIASWEVRTGNVRGKVPGCPVRREVQMFRLKGDGGN